MKSNQVFRATELAISKLLGLRWRRISKTNKRVWLEDAIHNQIFHFYDKDGAIVCVVEFTEMKFNDGLGYIQRREGKIINANGDVVLEEKELYDSPAYSVYEPKEHPLNDLYRIVWDKEFGKPISQEGKFPETIKLENLIEALRA